MTHFRGQIRGPHWGLTMDNMLIDFWRKHECLFNSSLETYYDKHLKTKLWTEFAVSIGKPVADVERRSRSLRTQYGRLLWHPERVNTFQQRMLREKLDFLRPYIVRRRGDLYLEDKFDDQEDDEEEEELETEGSVDQEMGSTFGSPLDANAGGRDPNEELQLVTSSPSNPAPQHCPNSQPQVTEVVSLSCDRHNHDEGSPLDQPDHTAALNPTSKYDILQQFAEVMLADMRQIKDPIVLMRLRRDITDLVFKAVEEDVQRRCVRVHPFIPSIREGALFQSSPSLQQQPPYSPSNSSWRQRYMRRKSKGSEMGRRMQRWEEVKHMRKTSRSQIMLLQPVQQGEALEGVNESIAQAMIQASEIKTETEPHAVKIEEETPPMV